MLCALKVAKFPPNNNILSVLNQGEAIACRNTFNVMTKLPRYQNKFGDLI